MNPPAPAYPDINSLRAAHQQMLLLRRELGETPEVFTQIFAFLQRAAQTGNLLDRDSERWEAQSLLDYWDSIFAAANSQYITPQLAEFDPLSAPQLPDDACPYRGLEAFSPQHRHLFFGRDEEIQTLLNLVQNYRMVSVVGPSGSGKSSLALGGLMGALQEDALPGSAQWRFLPRFVPGSRPLQNLRQALQAAGMGDALPLSEANTPKLPPTPEPNPLPTGITPTFWVIDQFEETFTLCDSEIEREAFLRALLHLATNSTTPILLALTMRTDFEDNLARYPSFQAWFNAAQVRTEALSPEKLLHAVLKPAQQIGLRFEEGLAEELVREVMGEPTALPLLQFTLLKLWEDRQRNRLTWDAYRKLGGGRQALARSANDFYENLIPEEQLTARRILLRMVRPAEGLEVTSSRVRRADLYHAAEAHDRIERVLDKLVHAHLLRLTPGKTPASDQFEVAHEALVRNWPRLVEWLEEERATLRRRARLSAAVAQWLHADKNPAALWRGALLEEVRDLEGLSKDETEFIQASIEAERLEAERKEAERLREIEQNRKIAETQSQRAQEQALAAKRLRWLGIALAIIFLVALFATNYGLQQSAIAQENEQIALTAAAGAISAQATADAERLLADEQAETLRLAQATAQAAAAQSLAAIEQAQAAQQAAQAAQADAEASSAEVLQLTQLKSARSLAAAAAASLPSNARLSLNLALQAAERNLSITPNLLPEVETALRQAIRNSQPQINFIAHEQPISAIAYTANGNTLLTAAQDGFVRLWQPETGKLEFTQAVEDPPIVAAALSPNGRWVAAITNKRVWLWDVSTPDAAPRLVAQNRSAAIWSKGALQFSPDSTRLAIFTPADEKLGQLQIFSIPDLRRLTNQYPGSEFGNFLLTYSSDGKFLILAGHITQIFSSATLQKTLEMRGHETGLSALAVSPNNLLLATAGNDGTARIWRFATGESLHLLNLSAPAVAMHFSPDSRLLTIASGDNRLTVWDTATGRNLMVIEPQMGALQVMTVNPQEGSLALGSASGLVQVWDNGLGLLLNRSGLTFTLHPSRPLLAIAHPDGAIRLWDLTTARFEQSFEGHDAALNTLTFDATAQRLVSGGQDGVARVWDATANTVRYFLFDNRAAFTVVAFHPNGEILVTGSARGELKTWRASDGKLLRILQSPDGFALRYLAFEPHTNLLLSANANGTLALWDVTDGSLLSDQTAHVGGISAFALTPDGTTLLTAGQDGQIGAWNAQTGEELAFLPQSGALGIPTADLLNLFGSPTDLIQQAPLQVEITAFAFSPDGKFLAAAKRDRSVWILDLTQGSILYRLEGYPAVVHLLAFTPDSRQVITGSTAAQIYLEPLNAQDLISLAKTLLHLPTP